MFQCKFLRLQIAACDPYDPAVMEEGFTEQNLSYYCDNLPVSSPNDDEM